MIRTARTPPASVLPALLVIGFGLLAPLAMMLRFSLNKFTPKEQMTEALTLANYTTFLSDPFYLAVLGRTVLTAITCTAASLLLGLPLAYWIAGRSSARAKAFWLLVIAIPLLMGNAARTAGWMVVLADRGVINAILRATGLIDEPIRILHTGRAVFIGLVSAILPFMVISLQSVLEGLDRRFEEAATSLGARPWTTIRTILLPLAMPGIFSGCLLCFILAINAYATPVLIGGPAFQMMAPKVYEQATKLYNWPFASAIAFILMTVTLASAVLSSVALQRRYGRV